MRKIESPLAVVMPGLKTSISTLKEARIYSDVVNGNLHSNASSNSFIRGFQVKMLPPCYFGFVIPVRQLVKAKAV